MNVNIAIASNIRKARKERGLTQQQAADMPLMDLSTYQRIESNRRQDYGVDLLQRISEAFGKTLEELIHTDTMHIEHIEDNHGAISSNIEQATFHSTDKEVLEHCKKIQEQNGLIMQSLNETLLVIRQILAERGAGQ